MKCKECGKLYGNMKDDGMVANPVLGELCVSCWSKPKKLSNGTKSGYSNVSLKKGDKNGR